MEKPILYINHSKENDSESDTESKEISENSDKKTLLKIIAALMDNNEVLRKYIEMLERRKY